MSDVEESRKGVKPHLLIVQQRLDLSARSQFVSADNKIRGLPTSTNVEVKDFKKRLLKLEKDLAKCDRKG